MFRKIKNLAEIQSSFTQAVEDLKSLRSRNSETINTNETKIILIQIQNDALSVESAQAEKFQSNLEALLA